MKRIIRAAVWVAVGMALASISTADVGIGEWVITKGNTIEVVGPDSSVDLQDIVDGIGDASATNRYLIRLGPGVYELGLLNWLELKEYVDLTGSGEGTTEILGNRSSGGGNCGSSQGIVVLPDNSILSDLTVTNESPSASLAYTLCNLLNSSPTIRRVTARATAGTGSRHAFHFEGGSPVLVDITGIADGGSSDFALYCNAGTPTVNRAWLTAKNGDTRNRAIWMVGSCSIEIYDLVIAAEDSPINVGIEVQTGTSVTLTNAVLDVTGASANTGIAVAGDGQIVLHNVQISPTGGATDVGIDASGDAEVRVARGTIRGSTAAIDTSSTVDALVSQSTLAGGGVIGSGSAVCVASDDGAGTELMNDCS